MRAAKESAGRSVERGRRNAMIKATSNTPDPSVVRHGVCEHCGQGCSYVPKDADHDIRALRARGASA